MYEIFAKLLENRGITPYQVFKDTGVAQSSLSDWKNGKSKPKVEKMIKIAEYFGVSLEYLMTGNEIKKSPTIVGDEQELTDIYFNFAKDAQDNNIDPDDIKAALELIKKFKNK